MIGRVLAEDRAFECDWRMDGRVCTVHALSDGTQPEIHSISSGTWNPEFAEVEVGERGTDKTGAPSGISCEVSAEVVLDTVA